MQRHIQDVVAWNLLDQLLEWCSHIFVDSSKDRHEVFFDAWDVHADPINASDVLNTCHAVHSLGRLDRITIDAAHEVSYRWIPGSSVWTTIDDDVLESLIPDSCKHKVVLVYDTKLFFT
jgi:hypothetical protein